MEQESKRPRSIKSMGRILIYITLISVAVVLLGRYLIKSWGGGGGVFSAPKEVQINYIPSDFNYEVDEENALRILSNPQRNRKEFNELVYNFNLSLLDHVAKRMNLPDTLQASIQGEYEKHHPYLRQLYYNDFIALMDTTGNLYQSWYENEYSSAVDVMNEVASKYTCFLVNHVISSLLKEANGTWLGKGSNVDTPCGIAMSEGLKPMMRRLKERAAITDFEKSKGLMEEKVERSIAELATLEVRDKKGLTKTMQTKFLGMSVSSTNLEVSAISILKVGFKIDQYFKIDVNSVSKQVVVELPEPTILSHEVYPKVDKLNIGWLREVDDDDFNKNFNLLRDEFRKEALDDNVMEKAKQQADELMQLMLGPVVNSFDNRYKLKIKFKRSSNALEEDDLFG